MTLISIFGALLYGLNQLHDYNPECFHFFVYSDIDFSNTSPSCSSHPTTVTNECR